VGTGVSFSF